MKGLTTIVVLVGALTMITDAEATLTCEPNPVAARTFTCTESIDNAGQYEWVADTASGALIDPVPGWPNMATYQCPPPWPPADVGGVPVQDVRQMTIQVVMPLLFLGMVAEHTTTVECSGQPLPKCQPLQGESAVQCAPSQLAIDPCANRGDSTPASRARGLITRLKGTSSTRSWGSMSGRGDAGGGAGSVTYTFGGYGAVYQLQGMSQGNENGVPRKRRCP